jgi:starch phosphorylase
MPMEWGERMDGAMHHVRRIAYFSMEIGLSPSIPTYSGGLGILAGDTVRAAADLAVPMVAVTLLHRKGYFSQVLDAAGTQQETPAAWNVDEHLSRTPARAIVSIEGRDVHIGAWQLVVNGVSGHGVPVFMLDTDLPENAPDDRRLTDHLYGGDRRYRLAQEIILGIGGVRILRALGHHHLECFHMNEGHAGLVPLELLAERTGGRARAEPASAVLTAEHEAVLAEHMRAVRRRCVFTTHTPVDAGHDRFAIDLVRQVIPRPAGLSWSDVVHLNGELNMTDLALRFSRYANAVARRHGEVSRRMFPAYSIDAITNGVHAATWTSPPIRALFDAHLPGWREDNFLLRHALNIPLTEIWSAHLQAKKTLIDHINRTTDAGLCVDAFTIGFARRATPYKRADLLIHDVQRLRDIAASTPPAGESTAASGTLQVVYAGKAHPHDTAGKDLIRHIFQAAAQLRPQVRIVYLPNYEIELARLVTAGVDLWLNTPKPPLEASGTSGMKAALNAVPSLSTLDGWWIEGCVEGVTGWAIGDGGAHHPPRTEDELRAADAHSLYEKLQHIVLPAFFIDRDRYLSIMRHAIALNGAYFNTHRMMQQYVSRAYFV